MPLTDRAAKVYDRLKGPVVPINICFNEDGTVNHDAVAAYIDFLCKEPSPVLLLTAGSSEYASLSEAEIWEVTATVGRANDDRALFVTSTGFWKPALTRDFLKHAAAVGAAAVKVQINPHLPMTREVITRYYDQIENASDIPLLLWTISTPRFPTELAIELAQRAYIVGMKNDGDPFGDYYDLSRATRDAGFAVVSGGQMRNFAFGYPLGSAAYLCPIAPFRPDIAFEFYNHLVAGDSDGAWQAVFRYEEPFLKWAVSQNWLGVMKSAIQLLGLYPNNLLGPPNPAPDLALPEIVRVKLEELFGPAPAR